MSIDTEPKDLGKVVQLVANRKGWRQEQVRFNLDRSILITGNPDLGIIQQTPDELVEPLRAAWLVTKERRPNDWNNPKVALRRLAVMDGILVNDAVVTDYFTLWGLPQAEESKPLFAQHEQQVVINRASSSGTAVYETSLPWGVCTHNILLDRNGDVLFMIRSMSQGFNQGRVSVTEEEQMEPDDAIPQFTSLRSFKEELGLIIPQERISLLGVAMEKGAAYPAYGFITETDLLAKDLIRSWRKARDFNENTALFVVPMTEIDQWMAADEVGIETWQRSYLSGSISADARLRLHNTSPWRLDLAKRFTQSS